MSDSRRPSSTAPDGSESAQGRSSKLRLVLVVVVLLVGVVAVAFVIGVLGAPSVTEVQNRFGGVNESTTVIESDLHTRNPNPIGVQLGGVTVSYAVTMNDITMATGSKSGLAVARGNSTVPFTTYMDNDKIPAWWVSHIRNGEQTTLAVNADVHSSLLGTSFGAPHITRSIDTDVLGAFNNEYDPPQEINADKEPLVRDPVLLVTETTGSWGTITEEETRIEMSFTLHNPKPYPIYITKIGYDIGMNDVSVGSGSTDHSYTIPPESSRTIEATTVIENQHLDTWWVTHLQRNQVTAMAIDFYLVVDLSEVGAGSIRIPLDTMEQTIETDFFDNKASARSDDGTTNAGDGEASSATPARTTGTPTRGTEETATPTSTATRDDGLLETSTPSTATPTATPTASPVETTPSPTSTPTPTPTPTPSPTPTPTPGDDGLLSFAASETSLYGFPVRSSRQGLQR